MNKIALSNLPKAWLIDIDGVVFAHNSHLDGEDKLLPATKDFINKLPETDLIILLSARKEKYRASTEASLKKFNVRYNQLIFDLPVGERVLINDTKPHGLQTAIAINTTRDIFIPPEISYSDDI